MQFSHFYLWRPGIFVPSLFRLFPFSFGNIIFQNIFELTKLKFKIVPVKSCYKIHIKPLYNVKSRLEREKQSISCWIPQTALESVRHTYRHTYKNYTYKHTPTNNKCRASAHKQRENNTRKRGRTQVQNDFVSDVMNADVCVVTPVADWRLWVDATKCRQK